MRCSSSSSTVVCCTAQDEPKGHLRCRFPGFGDVPATLGSDNSTISCCPPAQVGGTPAQQPATDNCHSPGCVPHNAVVKHFHWYWKLWSQAEPLVHRNDVQVDLESSMYYLVLDAEDNLLYQSDLNSSEQACKARYANTSTLFEGLSPGQPACNGVSLPGWPA